MKTLYTTLCALTLLGAPIQAKPSVVEGLCQKVTATYGDLDDGKWFTFTQSRTKDVVQYHDYDADKSIVLTVDKKHGNCALAKIEFKEYNGKKYQTVFKIKRNEPGATAADFFKTGRDVYKRALNVLALQASQ